MRLVELQPTTGLARASMAARPFADDVTRGPGRLSRSRDHRSGFGVVAARFVNSANVSFKMPTRPSPQLHRAPPVKMSHPHREGTGCVSRRQRPPAPEAAAPEPIQVSFTTYGLLQPSAHSDFDPGRQLRSEGREGYGPISREVGIS